MITPFEKVLVKVELAPYKIVDFDLSDNNVKLITNLNYEFFLDKNIKPFDFFKEGFKRDSRICTSNGCDGYWVLNVGKS